MSWYLDSSAILKLILDEVERPFLLKTLKTKSITSRISRVEVKRTVTRLAPEHLKLTNLELEKFDYLPLSSSVLSIAEGFTSKVTLKTLDALHIASVLALGTFVDGLITYDRQMIKNAKELGIKVISPGMK